MARIARLELRARGIVEGLITGMHRSPYFGQSAEFVQHRDYVAGDDVRRIDWKVWSKTDKYYIKQFEDETNLRITLLADCSASMSFASGAESKWDYACLLGACMAYLMLRQQDAVGLLVFDDQVRGRLPCSSRQTQFRDILAQLGHEATGERTAVADVLSAQAAETTRRSLYVVLSDLFAQREGLFKSLKLLKARGHEVLVFHILDDAELDFPYGGTTRFEGLESTGQLICDPRALRNDYLAAMEGFLQQVRRFCAAHQVDYDLVRTSTPLDAALRSFLNRREARTRKS